MAKKQDSKTITKQKAIDYWQLIGNINASKLSIDEAMNLADLRNDLDSQRKSFVELRQDQLKGYGVEINQDGSFDFTGHDKEDEIKDKLKEIAETEVKVSPANFLDKKKFFEAVKEVKSIHVVSELRDLLCKE